MPQMYKLPHLLGDVTLSSVDRALIMGGNGPTGAGEPDRFRLIVTGLTRSGDPIVTIEKRTGSAALGEPIWANAQGLPERLVIALMFRVLQPEIDRLRDSLAAVGDLR